MSTLIRQRFISTVFLTLSWSLAYAGAQVTIVNMDGPGEGFNDATPFTPDGGNPATTLGEARLIAFQHAAFILGSRLRSAIEIQVEAMMDPLFCNATGAALGAAGAKTVIRDFTGAPESNTWYEQALANSLANTDLDPATADAEATFNSDFGVNPVCGTSGWYYGLDGNITPGSGDVDFVTVVLHELIHAVGFSSKVDLVTGEKLLGFDDTYSDDLAQNGATPSDFPTMTDAERQIAVASDPNLIWMGGSVDANDGVLTAGLTAGRVRIYGPNPVQPGSSVSHFSTALTPNELMEPFYTGPNHTLGLALNLLEDIGWGIEPAFGVDVVFIVDLTGSTGALIADWIAQIPNIASSWQTALTPQPVRFALVSHFDYPFSPHGNTNEWAYRIESQLNTNPANLQAALNNLTMMSNPTIGTGGLDGPESQYEAIFQALTGEGRDLTAPINFTDLGEIPNTKLSAASRPTVIYHFTFPEVFHDRDTNPNYPFTGAVDTRGPGFEIPGRTKVLAELAAQASANTFFGLTFIGDPGLGSLSITAKDSEVAPLVLFSANEVSISEAMTPLEELASVSNGMVFNVSSSPTTPFDVELLEEAVEESVIAFMESPGGNDMDGDGASDDEDNCPTVSNASQSDIDGDGVGDDCDNCSVVFNPDQTDRDLNGLGDVCNCAPGTDADGDLICDATDLCPGVVQTDITQLDTDENGIPDACECGDFNGDGRTNTLDARLIQRCTVGQIPCEDLCDVNGDNSCNSLDARLIQRVAVGGIAADSLVCRQRNP